MSLKHKRTINYKEQGITLIALVVTIIVLLILAGVTIGTLTEQNSILTRAKETVWQNDLAEGKEQVELAWNAAYVEYIEKYYTNKLGENDTLGTEFVEEFNKIKNGNNYTATLDSEEAPTKVTVTSKSNKNQSVEAEIEITVTAGAVQNGSLGVWTDATKRKWRSIFNRYNRHNNYNRHICNGFTRGR